MTKKLEPTETIFDVTVSKKMYVQATGKVRVKARKFSTKKKFIKNSIVDIAERFESQGLFDIEELQELDWPENMEIEYLEEEDGRLSNHCPCCRQKVENREDIVIDLGEVND